MDLSKIENISSKFYAFVTTGQYNKFVQCAGTSICIAPYIETFSYQKRVEELPAVRQWEAGFYVVEAFSGLAIASEWPTLEDAESKAKRFCAERSKQYLLFRLAQQLDKTGLSPRYKNASLPPPKQLLFF